MGSISTWGLPGPQPCSSTAHQTHRWDNAQGRSQGIKSPFKISLLLFSDAVISGPFLLFFWGCYFIKSPKCSPRARVSLGGGSSRRIPGGTQSCPDPCLSLTGLCMALSCPCPCGEPSGTANQAVPAGGVGLAAQQPPVLSGVTSGAAP